MTEAESAATSPEALRTGPGRRLRRILDPILLLSLVLAAAPLLAPVSAAADLACQFLLQGAVLAGVLVPMFLLGRRFGRAALAALALTAQLWQIQPAGLAPAAAGVPGLRVVSFNLMVDNPTPDAVVAWLLGLDADLLALQEVDAGWRLHLRALSGRYPYRIDCFGRAGCDVALLSRYPLAESNGTVDPLSGAPLVAGVVETSLGAVRIATSHLTRPVVKGTLEGQLAQAAFLGRRLATPLPTLLVGDLNGVRWGRVVTRLERVSGLRALPGLEGTWPAMLPWPLRLPIDHALVSDGLPVAAREVLRGPGSDHLALLVTLGATVPDGTHHGARPLRDR